MSKSRKYNRNERKLSNVSSDIHPKGTRISYNQEIISSGSCKNYAVPTELSKSREHNRNKRKLSCVYFEKDNSSTRNRIEELNRVENTQYQEVKDPSSCNASDQTLDRSYCRSQELFKEYNIEMQKNQKKSSKFGRLFNVADRNDKFKVSNVEIKNCSESSIPKIFIDEPDPIDKTNCNTEFTFKRRKSIVNQPNNIFSNFPIQVPYQNWNQHYTMDESGKIWKQSLDILDEICNCQEKLNQKYCKPLFGKTGPVNVFTQTYTRNSNCVKPKVKKLLMSYKVIMNRHRRYKLKEKRLLIRRKWKNYRNISRFINHRKVRNYATIYTYTLGVGSRLMIPLKFIGIRPFEM